MKRMFFLLFAFACSGSLSAQSFKPYHSYGFQVNVNSSLLQTEHTGSYGQTFGGEDMNDNIIGFDIYAHYDYGIMKWLGVGTGLGFSKRGGQSSDMNAAFREGGKRSLTYLNLPVRVQFKPWHFLWIEPGIELMYNLGYKDDDGYFEDYHNVGGPFDADQINSVTVNFTPTLRFNVFRGLSINAGMVIGLTDVATVEAPSPPYPYIATTYKQWGTFIGLRYMLHQPEKGGR